MTSEYGSVLGLRREGGIDLFFPSHLRLSYRTYPISIGNFIPSSKFNLVPWSSILPLLTPPSKTLLPHSYMRRMKQLAREKKAAAEGGDDE